jgi:protein-disulfide isomerase-like protein with CxxC motif
VIQAMLHTDPGCPWAYSANPDIAVMRWRFGDNLQWRLVMIGLAENPERYLKAGYTPARQKQGQLLNFRPRFGMPFSSDARERVVGTGRACRAIVATRLLQPQLEWAVLRALQFGWFCTDLLMDEDEGIRTMLSAVPGLDARAVMNAIDDSATEEAYERDRGEARTAAGTPTEAQGKSATTDGPVRYTAPSVVFTTDDGRVLEAGGFQSIESYDVCVANLDPKLPRRPPPEDPYDALAAFSHGLTTQEVAAVLAPHLVDPDRAQTQARLIELFAEGRIKRVPMGDDALWRVA